MKEQDIQELLKKRIKCISSGEGHYPGSPFSIGYIITDPGYYERRGVDFNKYPRLFKEIPWYEERDQSQMPEYVKWDDNSYMYPQQRVSPISAAPFSSNGFTASNILPATLEEYNQYLNQQKLENKI